MNAEENEKKRLNLMYDYTKMWVTVLFGLLLSSLIAYFAVPSITNYISPLIWIFSIGLFIFVVVFIKSFSKLNKVYSIKKEKKKIPIWVLFLIGIIVFVIFFSLTENLNNPEKENYNYTCPMLPLVSLPLILPYCPKDNLVDWIVGIGTLSLALVALIGLFSGYIKKHLFGPKLDIDIKVEPPDCHKTKLTGRIISPRGQITSFSRPTYYCRFKVENNGKSEAKNVELMISKLYKKQNNGSYIELKDFTPLNLIWSYSESLKPPINILPGLFKYFDLLHIVKNEQLNTIFPNCDHTFDSAKIVFAFDFITQLNTFDFIRKPGEYAIEVIASFSDCIGGIEEYFSIKIKDSWTENENKMLKENIFIKKIGKIT